MKAFELVIDSDSASEEVVIEVGDEKTSKKEAET